MPVHVFKAHWPDHRNLRHVLPRFRPVEMRGGARQDDQATRWIGFDLFAVKSIAETDIKDHGDVGPYRQAAQLRRGQARDHARRRAPPAQRFQQPGEEFPPTGAKTRADHEALQVAAPGATVRFHPRSDRQRFLPPPQPRYRCQFSCRPHPGIHHLGRDHGRGDGCAITPIDGRFSTRRVFGYFIDDKLTVPFAVARPASKRH